MSSKSQFAILQDRLVRARTNHIFHFILSIVTAGLWIVVWFVVALSNSIERYSIERKMKRFD